MNRFVVLILSSREIERAIQFNKQRHGSFKKTDFWVNDLGINDISTVSSLEITHKKFYMMRTYLVLRRFLKHWIFKLEITVKHNYNRHFQG